MRPPEALPSTVPHADSAGVAAQGAPSVAQPKGGLRGLAVRGSLFEMAGYGAQMVIRLGSNMVMSRLLFPSAFGLMALVGIFVQGLIMLSDVGIEPAVIQNKDGDQVSFLNTAWTMQAVRGFLLYAALLLVAHPLALLYKEPQLFPLTCVSSFSLVLGGLNSTSLFTLRRRLAIVKLTLVELGSQVAALVVMVPWAYFRPTVWVLVGGWLVSSAVKTIASHSLDVGYRNRFAVDKAARRAIGQFGKYVFLSSIFYFLSRQADRILLGRFLGVAELGVYSIAFILSDAIGSAVARLSAGILFPILSRIRLEGDARLRAVYYKARLGLDLLCLPATGALTMLGPWVIHLLYDKRYAAAGWILQAFALRVAMSTVLTPCETCLSSVGLNRYAMYHNVVRAVWMVGALPIGWHFWGLQGVVWATALSESLLPFVLWPPFRAIGMFSLAAELRAVALYLGGLAVGWLLSGVLHP